MLVKIGSRKSRLALVQTEQVIVQIKLRFPDVHCQIVPIITTGDIIVDRPLYEIGGKVLFLKEIEQQLIDKKIDIAAHSLKDVPGILPKELVIAALLEREDPRDVLICKNYKSIEELPLNAVIGTASVRRRIFLHKIRPDLNIVLFRGNVDSRIKKFEANEVDGIVLGAAGLKRLGLINNNYCHILPTSQMLPAIGQGVIAIETRKDNQLMLNLCKHINHEPTSNLMTLERAFLEYLNADCKVPIGAYSEFINKQNLKTKFMISDFEEQNIFFHEITGKIEDARKLGFEAAETMLNMQKIKL